MGDIVGEKTILALKQELAKIQKEYHIHLILANAENTSGGKGLCYKHYKELKSLGIVGMSMGNHTFSKSEIKEYLSEASICIPANWNAEYKKDVLYIRYNDKKIAIVNLLGRIFMNTPLDCPFQTMERLLPNIDADYIIVDFHGEATSEKKAFFYEFAGKVSAVLGTHTHIQTADEQVYNNTCYITDLGMCGVEHSILGDNVESVIKRFKTGVYEPLAVASGKNFIINGVILDLKEKNEIERIYKKITLV